jgi:hypothetical protein
MHPVYLALAVYYAIPMAGLFAAVWWKTDLIMGSRSSYWQERRDLMWIAKSLAVSALWPVAGVALLLDLSFRSKREREMDKACRQMATELRILRATTLEGGGR